VDEPRLTRIILLLGSYDKQTKPVLVGVKDNLEQAFVSHPEQVSALLLDETELYRFDLDGRELTIFIEKYEGGLTLSVLDAQQTIDTEDFSGKNDEKIDEIIIQYLADHYQTKSYVKFTLLEKLRELSQFSSLVFLIRDQELTRGGEYIELGFLLSLPTARLEPSKVQFFKREGMDLSEMAWEILDLYKINKHPYKDQEFLLRETVRITRNALV